MTSAAEPNMRPTGGAVLVGGENRRFGSPKWAAELEGTPLLARVLTAVRSALPKVILVGAATPELLRFGVPVVGDAAAAAGPLGGLLSALRWGRETGLDGVCLSPCDAPFVPPDLFEAVAGASAGQAAVIPCWAGRAAGEPLFGWYSCSLEEPLSLALEAGRRSVNGFIASLDRVRLLDVDPLGLNTPSEMIFFNMNTPLDHQRAIERLSGSDGASR
jgi:molybdenum cofactor guanylyltransferase